MEMSNSIIKRNGYKIEYVHVESAVLIDGSVDFTPDSEKYKNYRLLSNDVDFYWGRKGYKVVTLLISYNGTELARYENPNFQLVVDYLNKFDSLSRQEIKKLAVEAQEDSKTQLELEIKALKTEKEKLLDKVAILKEIEEKKSEIKQLLTKLDE